MTRIVLITFASAALILSVCAYPRTNQNVFDKDSGNDNNESVKYFIHPDNHSRVDMKLANDNELVKY